MRPKHAGAVRRPLELTIAPGTTDEELLRSFVGQVREWRSPDVSHLRFRQDDIVVLVGILGTDAKEIERRLIELTGCDRRTARRVRRLLLVGLAALPAGVVVPMVAAPTAAAPVHVGAFADGGLAANAKFDQPPHLPAFSDTADPAVAVIPSPATSTPIAPPTTPTPEPAAALAPGVEAMVSIARLGIDLPVSLGGQSVIDQGVVAHYTAEGWRPPAAAGATGTYWLAAHHLSHGAPFGALPSIAVGDEVRVTTATQTFTYTVTSTEVVLPDAGFGPVYGSDPEAKVILLQTCLDMTRRLLVHGTLTATS